MPEARRVALVTGSSRGLGAAIARRLARDGTPSLVLNATGPQPEAAVTEVAWADHLAQLSFFVKSPVLLGRALLPGKQARRFGRIIHVDYEVADQPQPGPLEAEPARHLAAAPAATAPAFRRTRAGPGPPGTRPPVPGHQLVPG